MGCLFSKNGQVRTLSDDVEEPLPASAFSTRGAAHAWLQEIGLPQYAEAFEDAGFSDWDLLSCLTETDLEAITAHTATRIPPGHRKKLLMASRQMGATGAQTGLLGSAPPGVSARRYSHSSNPGNGNNSRAGGLAAAAAAVMSLERRSNGPRLGSTSRVPSLASIHPGVHPGPGHTSHPLLGGGGGTPSRNATEDGLVSGRRCRAVGVMVPSRNSSRNSLPAMAIGHTIGYIASPEVTARQEAGIADAWVFADGRRSPAEPCSPSGAPSGAGGLTQLRPRRRWSANKCASHGVLIGSGAGAGGGSMPVADSSYGWLEQVAASALGGALPITDNARQMSVTSSICDVIGIGGGGGAVPAIQPSISRDLDALVVGAGGGAINPAQVSRSLSLAARAERSYGGGSNHGLPASPPHRSGAGQPSSNGHALTDLSYVRGSARQAATASVVQQQQPQGPAGHTQSHPGMDVSDLQQIPSQQQQKQRVSSARDGAASAHAPAPPSAMATAGGGTGGIGIQGSPSLRRPGSAADASQKSGQSPQPATRPPTVSSCASIATAAALPASPHQPPAVAWPSHGGTHVASAPAAGAAATAAAGPQRVGDAALPSSSGARGAGGPGGALPRFVRALAGWAIPSPASGAGATTDSGGGIGSAAAATASRRVRSGNRQRRTYQRQSVPQQTRPQSRAGSAANGPQGYAPEHQASKAEGDGDLLAMAAAAATAGTASRGSAVVAATNPSPHEEIRSARSQRQLLVPDAATPRGVWDQETALCIQGRGYKPQTVARGPSMQRFGDAHGRGGSGPGDGDSDGAPSSVSCPASAHAVAPAAASVAATAAAARGGGWPFVMPQLPLAPRGAQHDAPGPPSSSAAATQGAAGRGGPAATAAVAAVAAAPDFEASSGSYGAVGGSPAVAMHGKMSVVRESLPSMLLESLASDASAATTARRAPPAHSSRPRDWYPSVGGTSEGTSMTAAEHSGAHPGAKSDADTESSADELALCGSSSLPRPHRVQIVSSAMAMAAPYNTGGGAAAAAATARQSQSAAAAAQWPAMPLQPPTRAKPPPARGRGSDGGDRRARMQVLPPEAPGPNSGPPGDNGSAGARGPASGKLPHPTPGRKLDLEMLAEQVGRIMTHLSNITRDGDEHGEPGAGPAAAAAAAAAGGDAVEGDAERRGADAGGDAMEVQLGVCAGGGGDGIERMNAASVSLRPCTRLQAIDHKRQELQHLHQDLVRRVATLAPDVAPPATAGDGAAASRASGAGTSQPSSGSRPSGGGSAAAAAESSAAEALAEVEARIRTKLAELAALTMRPDPERRTAAVPAAGGGAAAAAGTGVGGSSSPGGTRKRALGLDSAGESPVTAAAAAGWDGAGYGGGAAGHRRARDEAALHMEVLAVLGARKRQVRGASAAVPPPAAVVVAGAGPGRSGSDGGGQGQQGVVAAGPNGGLLGKHSQAPAASARGDAPGGVVLAEMHDALKAELLAIDSRIKARVLGSGPAVSRRG